jgi:uncharacterized protein (TIGR02266 family)
MAVERRKARRASIPGMRVAFEAAAGELAEADVLDVGTGGLFIRTAKPIAVGKRLSLEVAAVAGIAAWTALGRVVWTRDTGTKDAPPGMGVKLIDVDDVVVAAIDRAVEAREKARTGAVAVPSRERTVLGLGAAGAPPAAKPPEREPSVQEPAPGDWDLPDVHGMTTRVVEVPRMVEPETPPREEEPLPTAPAAERREAAPQRDSPPPEPQRRGGRWVLLLLVVAVAAAALYAARDHIPWAKGLVETWTGSPPAPTPAEPAPALPAATATAIAPSSPSTVGTWMTSRPPKDAPTASETPVHPPPSASPRAATTGGGPTDNPY